MYASFYIRKIISILKHTFLVLRLSSIEKQKQISSSSNKNENEPINNLRNFLELSFL